jgi:hypothetical protein
MKKSLAFFFTILNVTFCLSQIKGHCIDEFGKAIPYANIGIENTGSGTVSDKEGVFTIDSKSLPENNTIIISCLGYITKSINVPKKAEIEITLKSNVYELNEVTVGLPKYKIKKIGNNLLSRNIVVAFSSHNLGSEVGKFIKIVKGKSYIVEKIHFNISEMGYKKGVFRVNFYNATDEKNIDNERVNTKDIIMEVSNSGDVDVNVTEENLIFSNSFLVSIECIEYSEKTSLISVENKNIYFSSNVFCGPVYYRANKITKWTPTKSKYNLCLGIQLFVKY